MGRRSGINPMTRSWLRCVVLLLCLAVESHGTGPGSDPGQEDPAPTADKTFQDSVSWQTAGDRYRRHSQLEQAEDAYEKARKIREELGPRLALAESLSALGVVTMARWQLDRAEDLHRQAYDIRRELAPNSAQLASSLNGLGLVAATRRDLDTAEDLLERARDLLRHVASNSLEIASSHYGLGLVAIMRGELETAATNFERALEIRLDLAPGEIETARSLLSVSVVSRERGDLERSSRLLGGALEIYERMAPESLDMADCLHNLADVTFRRGDTDSSRHLHLRALEIRRKLAPGRPQVAASLHFLGYLAERRGDLDEALARFQEAAEIWPIELPNSVELANTLTSLGKVVGRQGDPRQAAAHYRQALKIQRQVAPGSLYEAGTLSKLGDAYHAIEDYERAAGFHREALDIRRRRAPDSTIVAQTLRSLGVLLAGRTPPESEAASSHFHKALDTLERQLARLGGTSSARSGFRARYYSYYRDALEHELTQHRVDAAFHILERSRAGSLLEQFAERDAVFADVPTPLDLRRRELAGKFDRVFSRLAGSSDPEEIETRQAELQKLRFDASTIEEEIRLASPRLAALRYPQPHDADAARAALDRGTLMLSYSVGEDNTHLFLLARDQPLEVHTVAIGEKTLRQHIAGLHETTDQRGWQSRAQNRFQHASLLYDLLLSPAEAAIRQSKRLLIVPDGPLHQLPFAALIRPTGGGAERPWQYLVEWKPLHFVLSATVYSELKKARRDHDAEKGGGARVAAFGDPQYPEALRSATSRAEGSRQPGNFPNIADDQVRSAAERGFGFSPLPSSRREVEQIAGLFPETSVYLGAKATEEQVKAIGKEARILHLAVHGIYDEELPFNSALALSIPEEPSGGHDNGLLQVWEIFERMRLDADLVVLSACDSALGKEMGGEGLIGLTRAFHYAGARSVAATLWKVADRSTTVLMASFYRHLRSGKPKDEALRAAQIELIRGPTEVLNTDGEPEVTDASAPYYWGAFQIYGDWI